MSNLFTPDFSLDNPEIASFFKENGPAPVREFLYIHTHPVKVNFLTEIEAMISMTATILLQQQKSTGKVNALPGKMEALAIKYAGQINEINSKTAPEILATLKEIFRLCDGVIENFIRKANREEEEKKAAKKEASRKGKK